VVVVCQLPVAHEWPHASPPDMVTIPHPFEHQFVGAGRSAYQTSSRPTCALRASPPFGAWRTPEVTKTRDVSSWTGFQITPMVCRSRQPPRQPDERTEEFLQRLV